MADLPKNVLESYFDSTVNQESPLMDSYVREVSKDEKGTEVVKYVPFDSAEYQKSLGFIDMWTLNALLSAGIDPSFGVHTGTATRLEGELALQNAIGVIENELDNSKSE